MDYRNSQEFLEALRKRLGPKDSGTLELMGTTGSLDMTEYQVQMIPRKPQGVDEPQPQGETPKD
jgi:hypothetical protein